MKLLSRFNYAFPASWQTPGTAHLKSLFVVTVVALLLSRTNINVPGFVPGALTQLGAIFVETWRVLARAA